MTRRSPRRWLRGLLRRRETESAADAPPASTGPPADEAGEPVSLVSRELPQRGTERWLLALFGVVVLASGGFIAAYAAGGNTQLLGLTIGIALAALALAAIVAANRVVPQEEAIEERPDFGDPAGQRQLEEEIEAGVEGVTRRRALAAGAGAAGLALGAAMVAPLASLGPAPGEQIGATPWRRGVRVVDPKGRRLTPEDVPIGSFVTGFPEGASRRELGSAVVLVRLPEEELELPAERADWAPEGVLAYSKICTHAGCAINLYRYPLYEPTSKEPALVCPCHYSTFDVARGGERVFGPAGRALPQLPLELADDGTIMARAGFDDDIGPSWSGVRLQ